MFEAAELGRSLSKKEYEEALPQLRVDMIEVQQQLRGADFPAIVVFAGVDGAGKGETVNLLNEWMDPRWMVTHAYGEPSDEEAERPEFWRFWRDLPPRGKLGLYLSSWYSRPVLERVYGELGKSKFRQCLQRIQRFEKMLADDGALVLKFWMHLGKSAQKKRLKALERDEDHAWRVTERDWKHYQLYDKFAAAAEEAIMLTSTAAAPWKIVEGEDFRYRSVTVATLLHDAIRDHLHAREVERSVRAARTKARAAKPANESSGIGHASVLHALDTSQKLSKKDYESSLHKQQGRLNRLAWLAKQRDVSTILVFQGWDAAGKGGAIRRVTAALDARQYDVIQVAAPTDEERSHHYLWRFWRHLSRAGRFTIYDRSWYGRVLVERVEGFATDAEWSRAYAEINHYEEALVDHGIVLVKFWLHITPDEQLRRFERREAIAYKRWKLTEEDWRNRERWADYELAVNEMVERTSTHIAPWTLVEANNKRFARIKVLRTVCDRLEAALG